MAYRTLLIGQGLRRLSPRSGNLHSSAREGSLNRLREMIVTGNGSSRVGKVTFCAVCALQPFGCFCCDTCPGSWILLGQAARRLDLGHDFWVGHLLFLPLGTSKEHRGGSLSLEPSRA